MKNEIVAATVISGFLILHAPHVPILPGIYSGQVATPYGVPEDKDIPSHGPASAPVINGNSVVTSTGAYGVVATPTLLPDGLLYNPNLALSTSAVSPAPSVSVFTANGLVYCSS